MHFEKPENQLLEPRRADCQILRVFVHVTTEDCLNHIHAINTVRTGKACLGVLDYFSGSLPRQTDSFKNDVELDASMQMHLAVGDGNLI